MRETPPPPPHQIIIKKPGIRDTCAGVGEQVDRKANPRMIAMSNAISSEIDRERNEVRQQDDSLAMLVLVIPLIVVKNVSPTTQACHEEWSWKSYPKLYIVSLFALQYVFLLVVISVSHVRIGIYVSRSNCNLKRVSVSTAEVDWSGVLRSSG